MKASFKFCILMVFILAVSCKDKEVNSDQAPFEIPKDEIYQIEYISYNDDPQAERWYEYNDQGDITREAMDIDTIEYDYQKGKIVKRHLNKSLSWHSATAYFTDSSGRIISSDIYDEDDKKVSSIKYAYNSEGYLIKTEQFIFQSSSNSVSEFEYKDGNMVKIMIYDIEGKLAANYLLDYFPDKVNILNLFIENISDDILPNERVGKRNKNLVKQLSNVTREGDTLSLVKYNYGDISNGILTCVQIDELNEFETKIVYHLK